MKPSWPIRLAIAAIAIATVGLVATWVVPLAPRWPFVLLQHFRVQCAVGGAVVVACAGALRMAGWFDAAAIATLLHVVWISPDLNRAAQPIPTDGVPVRVLMLNVHTESSRSRAAITSVSRSTRERL